MNDHSVDTVSSRADLSGATLRELQARRDEILRIVIAHDADNVRVFGSVARA